MFFYTVYYYSKFSKNIYYNAKSKPTLCENKFPKISWQKEKKWSSDSCKKEKKEEDKGEEQEQYDFLALTMFLKLPVKLVDTYLSDYI